MTKGKDVKMSIDGKKFEKVRLGELDKNIGGHEMQPTLQERNERLYTEIDKLINSALIIKELNVKYIYKI